jgi:hypothetical protein
MQLHGVNLCRAPVLCSAHLCNINISESASCYSGPCHVTVAVPCGSGGYGHGSSSEVPDLTFVFRTSEVRINEPQLAPLKTKSLLLALAAALMTV